MKKILITGANGVLARKVLEKLVLNKENVVYAATRDKKHFEKIYPGIVCVGYEDIFQSGFLKEIDLVLNCAFPRQFDMDILGKALGWYNELLSKAVEMNVLGFVNISSQSVYGNYREDYVDESGVIMPQDSYALTKYACELLGRQVMLRSRMRITNLRLASLIGVEYPERVINKMIMNAKHSDIISVNNSQNVFGYMDIDDAAEGIAAFVCNSNMTDWDFCYNVGMPKREFKDFAFIAECIGALFAEKNSPRRLDIQTKDKADKLCLMSSEKFFQTAQWAPRITLEEAVSKIFRQIS